MSYVEGKTGPWEVVIGLEVHAQIISKSKLFSGADTSFGAEPNTQVSFVDAGFPGMLPVINTFCVEQAIKTGLALNAVIHEKSIFARKNYFYADLPTGYQISQFEDPIVGLGHLDIELSDGTTKRIGITRLHLEQDAGKSFHDQHPTKSYIDLNRAGVALMEIVSEPDLRSAEEVMAYLKKLRALLRCLETCDGNMEEGSMRADVNVSLRRPGEPFGTRAEIKNVNSIRFAGQAVEYEIARQMEILEEGGVIVQETRLFDSNKNETRSMRSKEHAQDYRYFPDPDLPPLILEKGEIERVKASMPELPDAKKARFMSAYGLPSYDAEMLSGEKENALFYEEAVSTSSSKSAKLISNWMLGELFAVLNKMNVDLKDSPISAVNLGKLVDLIVSDVISGKIAKDVLLIMAETGEDPEKIVEKNGLKQVTDTGAIEKIIDDVLAANPDKVAEYRSGKDKLFGFFIGQIMKAMEGKGNPAMVNDILKDKLLS
jgi:aspartyl-tRNA(Asn)/glutamyl-tRNA(Gln) amidotransferase subunit B